MEEQKKLRRSTENKMIAGICAGIANYFRIDPTIVRVLYVLMVLFVGFGILLYLILWIIIPKEN